MQQFLSRYRYVLLALLLALYTLPLQVAHVPNYSLDGSWITALNHAIHSGAVFGRDFVFTYGPLGFFSTRNDALLSRWWLLLADALLVLGYFRFFRKYVVVEKWWWIPALAVVLMLRSTNYSQSLFLLFITSVSMCVREKGNDYVSMAYTALIGVVLFFIKVNYGIVALPVLLALLIWGMWNKQYRQAGMAAIIAIVSFVVICAFTHIAVGDYIRYSLPLISHYDEAMGVQIRRGELQFAGSVIFLAVFVGLLAGYLFRQKKMLPSESLVLCGIWAFAFFMMYKNGFTRYDQYHFSEYYATMPYLLLMVMTFMGAGAKLRSWWLPVASMLLSGYCMILPDIKDGSLNVSYYASYMSPISYWASLTQPAGHVSRELRVLGADKRAEIGNHSMDIFTWEVQLADNYGMNYKPRPIPQSYSAYSAELDSLNAAHFYHNGRPDMLLFQNFPIDGRYCFWDEALTKAAISINYHLIDSIQVNCKGRLVDDPFDTYLLFQANNDHYEQPQYRVLEQKTVALWDTVAVKYPGDKPIFMKADIAYSKSGKLRRIFYQVPDLRIVLFFDDGSTGEFKAVRSVFNTPVLINKLVRTNAEALNFFTGHAERNRNVTAFAFKAANGFDNKYTVSFLEMTNYSKR